ncbi:hypothetical protein AN958_12603 [Leucoagaricus sp. SymC.cos]|nr:hypothetical protein AN958_12603 [Leucoagaricus sp. SymC.cos]
MEYSHYGLKEYDSFFNEWNCWPPLEDPTQPLDADEESGAGHLAAVPESVFQELTSLGLNQKDMAEMEATQDLGSSTTMKSFLNARHIHNIDAEQAQSQVLELLTAHFGFVPPIPLPTSTTDSVTCEDVKCLADALGLPGLTVDSGFFTTVLGKMCAKFACSFVSQMMMIKPLGHCC